MFFKRVNLLYININSLLFQGLFGIYVKKKKKSLPKTSGRLFLRSVVLGQIIAVSLDKLVAHLYDIVDRQLA